MTDPVGRVLVAEDDRSLRTVVAAALSARGHEVITAGDFDQARAVLAHEDCHAAVVDIGLPGGSGLDLLAAADDRVPVIVVTARSTMDNAVAAMRAGAFEYLTKPFDLDELEQAVDRAVRERLEASEPPESLDDGGEQAKVLVGRSRAMQQVFKAIGRAAARRAPVLIEGESGTGKELVARTIHRYSARASGPFVAVNMAALPESLAEAELFGHERGAFTGAATARSGLIRAADGGTLFLDEVGELPLPLQAKLLRVLEEGEVTPIGSTAPRKTDVRVISATNRQLRGEVDAGRFRADLYYRLYVLPIMLPPLRQRREDIPELCEHVLAGFATRRDERPRRLSAAALRSLSDRDWPGNVRELINELLRAVAFTDSPVLEPEDFEQGGREDPDGGADLLRLWVERRCAEPGDETLYSSAMAAFERVLLERVLREAGGNQVRAAERLGIHRNSLSRRLSALGLKAADFRDEGRGA